MMSKTKRMLVVRESISKPSSKVFVKEEEEVPKKVKKINQRKYLRKSTQKRSYHLCDNNNYLDDKPRKIELLNFHEVN